jgi:DNA-directed RNA polymerase specialized sigma subunit
MPIRRDIILAVREMMDRHFTVSDMAAKLNISVELVQQALDIINNLLT